MSISKELSSKEYLRYYIAASKLKWSREKFAHYMGIAVNTVSRRALTVKKEFGVNLEQLRRTHDEEELTDNDVNAIGVLVNRLKEDEEKTVQTFATLMGTEKTKPGIYVITSAQNATPVNQKFLGTILQYCEYRDATLLVVPYRYKNPTSIFAKSDKDHDYWAPALEPYLINSTVRLAPNLVVVADLKVQPTAIDPLSGLDGYVGENSAIIGHPKIQFKTVPTPSQMTPKILSTTGAVTVPNYTDSKAGFKGRFHYSLAAVIVEVEKDGTFHIRHIHGKDDGSFYDLDTHYSPSGITTGHRVAALITGDSHVMFIDDSVEKATYSSKDSICNVLRPEIKVYHDLTDFFSRSHHHKTNDLLNYAKHKSGLDNVELELQMSADFIDKNSTDDCLDVIVKSNHDEAFDRWLREADPKTDPENSRFYYYMKYHQLKNLEVTDTGYKTIDPFEFWCRNPDAKSGLKTLANTRFLQRDESMMIAGIEVGFHGDAGPNGARGSIKAFTNIGPKCIIGHAHSPGIYESVYQVGTSSKLNMNYVSGPSSWLHSHVIIYKDGSRALISIINGKWRATT